MGKISCVDIAEMVIEEACGVFSKDKKEDRWRKEKIIDSCSIFDTLINRYGFDDFSAEVSDDGVFITLSAERKTGGEYEVILPMLPDLVFANHLKIVFCDGGKTMRIEMVFGGIWIQNRGTE